MAVSQGALAPFLWFLDQVELSTGVVAPTTCSELLVLNYLYGYPEWTDSRDTSGLPAELVGLHIIVTPQTEGSKPWTATVTEVMKRTPRYVRVRREDRP